MEIYQRPPASVHPGCTFISFTEGSAPGSPVPSTLGEIDLETSSLSSYWNNFAAEVGNVYEGEAVVVTNLTPSICTTENWPIVGYVANGQGAIRLQYKSVARKYRLSFSSSGGGSEVAITDYAAGGHIDHAWSILKPLLDAPGKQIGHFSGLASGGSWSSSILGMTRNTNCWAYGFDLSGIGFKSTKRCPVVTDQHVVAAAHYRLSVGDVLNFLGSDGIWYQRTVIGISPHWDSSSPFLAGDKQLAVLDSALPASVKRYPVIADDFGLTNWLAGFTGSTMNSFHFTGLWINQFHQIALAGNHSPFDSMYSAQESYYYGETETVIAGAGMVFGGYSLDYPSAGPWMDDYKSAWFKPTIGGDSGSPLFYPLNGTDLVLLGTLTGGSGSAGLAEKSVIDMLVGYADADAIARGNLASPTGLTVTVAPDPTL